MFGSALWLTLITILGLVAGFAREWLLVACWGAGARTDGFLVAVFLPEAIRMTLGSGVLAAAGLSLFQQQPSDDRRGWISTQMLSMGGAALLLAAVLAIGAPWWVAIVGPGLSFDTSSLAASTLRMLAWSVVPVVLHGVLSVPLQARQRFVLVGLGSLLYNLPSVLVMWWYGSAVTEKQLALAIVYGALLMLFSLLFPVWRQERVGRWLALDSAQARALYARLGPLLASAGASQGLALLERVVASWLGEGAITVLNLARKLVNLPLVALMSLNQVLLGAMSAPELGAGARQKILLKGMQVTTLLTVPAAAGMLAAAPVLVAWFLPVTMHNSALPQMLAWLSAVIILGAWNALLARYSYAQGDTRMPLRLELCGNAVNALLLLLVPSVMGLPGIAVAAMGGCVVTGGLFLWRYRLLGEWRVQVLPLIAALALLIASCIYLAPGLGDASRFALASGNSLFWLGLIALLIRRSGPAYSR